MESFGGVSLIGLEQKEVWAVNSSTSTCETGAEHGLEDWRCLQQS